MLESIIYNSRLQKRPSKQYTVPSILECPNKDALLTDDVASLPQCLEFLNLPPFPSINSAEGTVEYLQALSACSAVLLDTFKDAQATLRVKMDRLSAIRREEDATDRMEIKLTRFKEDYPFIDNMGSADAIRSERLLLQSAMGSIDTLLCERLRRFVEEVKKLDLHELLEIARNSVEYCEMMAYFEFLTNSTKEIEENLRAKSEIRAMGDSVKKRLCLALIRHGSISLRHFAASLGIDGKELVMIVAEMSFFGIVIYDNNDIVQLR